MGLPAQIEPLCGEARRVGTMANTLARLGRFEEGLTPAEVDRIHPARAAVAYAQAAAAMSWAGLRRFQGSSSCRRDAGWSLIRRSTSASQARGSVTVPYFTVMMDSEIPAFAALARAGLTCWARHKAKPWPAMP